MIALKLFVFALIAVAIASESPKPVAQIISDKSSVDSHGYNFEFQTSDGVSRKEEAGIIKIGDKEGIAVRGSYSYIAPDGLEYQVTFTADDKGYKPQIRVVPHQQ